MTARLSDKDKPSKHNAENRRANKPLMEKRRRARINQSLALLKTIVVDSNKIEGSHKHSKLEKADILELTVKHLQTLQKNHGLKSGGINSNDNSSESGSNPGQIDNHNLARFQQGFEECTREVASFLATAGADPKLASSLLEHLNFQKTVSVCSLGSSTKSSGSSSVPPDSGAPTLLETGPYSPVSISPPHSHSSPSPCSPSSTKSQGSHEQTTTYPSPISPSSSTVTNLQVIPTRLPNGQVVFLVPKGPEHPATTATAAITTTTTLEDQPLDFRKKTDTDKDDDDDIAMSEDGALNLCKRPPELIPEGDSVWRPW